MPVVLRPTITQTFLERVKTSPNKVGFEYKPTNPEAGPIGQWKKVTYQEYLDECRLVSYGLMGLGVRKKDKVVILSNTRYEWSLSDMAILGAGGTTVPIYASNTADDVEYIIDHCEARIAIVEDTKQLEKILTKRAEKANAMPLLERVIVLEPAAMLIAAGRQDVMTLFALKELGRREEARDPSAFERNMNSAEPADAITICYTSGTTGVPKGAIITQDNIMSVIEDAWALYQRHMRAEEEVTLSFLPFSHIVGKVESMLVYSFGIRQCFAENIDKLMINMAEAKPTVIFSVPRIFEKAFTRINAMLEQGPAAKKKMFDWAFAAGREYYGAVWAHKRPPIKAITEHAVASKLVFGKVRGRFGGRFRFALCGGAPLPREIGEYFQIVGIQICEGYGLTETTGPITLNTPDDLRFGTVGRPLPEVSIKIADDGEILVKSRKVFAGYYRMPRETEEALEGGWFHTGDIGHLDADGFLHITDRKKDIIVTSGGKNVAPQKIENLAKTHKYISQFVVHGDRRNYLTALVTLDREAVIKFANEQQILFSEYSELVKNPKVQALVQKVIDEVNHHLAKFETIKKFLIIPNDFTIEAGELTPSLKVRRNFIGKKYRNELDSMYAS